MNIVERERPRGVIVQFGGQTPLKLVVPLERAGVPILGTPPDAIDRAEDRQRFADLRTYMTEAVRVSPEHPILVDKFLEDALEIDVDAIADGERVVVGGVMEHVEKAGVHSGDSACALPPYSLGDDQVAT